MTRKPADEDPRAQPSGEQMRRAVLGDAHVDRARAKTTPFTAAFQELIERYAWGEIWTRPGLPRAERSIVALAVLATLKQDDELALHVVGAVRNGLTPEQIAEIFLQVAVYAGVPAANRAFAVAQSALSDAGLLPGPAPSRATAAGTSASEDEDA